MPANPSGNGSVTVIGSGLSPGRANQPETDDKPPDDGSGRAESDLKRGTTDESSAPPQSGITQRAPSLLPGLNDESPAVYAKRISEPTANRTPEPTPGGPSDQQSSPGVVTSVPPQLGPAKQAGKSEPQTSTSDPAYRIPATVSNVREMGNENAVNHSGGRNLGGLPPTTPEHRQAVNERSSSVGGQVTLPESSAVRSSPRPPPFDPASVDVNIPTEGSTYRANMSFWASPNKGIRWRQQKRARNGEIRPIEVAGTYEATEHLAANVSRDQCSAVAPEALRSDARTGTGSEKRTCLPGIQLPQQLEELLCQGTHRFGVAALCLLTMLLVVIGAALGSGVVLETPLWPSPVNSSLVCALLDEERRLRRIIDTLINPLRDLQDERLTKLGNVGPKGVEQQIRDLKGQRESYFRFDALPDPAAQDRFTAKLRTLRALLRPGLAMSAVKGWIFEERQ